MQGLAIGGNRGSLPCIHSASCFCSRGCDSGSLGYWGSFFPRQVRREEFFPLDEGGPVLCNYNFLGLFVGEGYPAAVGLADHVLLELVDVHLSISETASSMGQARILSS